MVIWALWSQVNRDTMMGKAPVAPSPDKGGRMRPSSFAPLHRPSRSAGMARLLDRLLHRVAPEDVPLLRALSAAVHDHPGPPPPGERGAFSPVEQTLADICAVVAVQFELQAAPAYSRFGDPLAAEYTIFLPLGPGYALEGSYGNLRAENAFPNRGWIVLLRLPRPGTAEIRRVVRSAALQCSQPDEHIARAVLDVLQPAIQDLRRSHTP